MKKEQNGANFRGTSPKIDFQTQPRPPGSSLVWRVTRDENLGEIGNNSQPDWSTFNVAFSTSGI